MEEDGRSAVRLISVNIGKEQPIRNGKPSGKTGIFKLPSAAPVMIASMGLEGDAIVDTENHGGVDQAVYLFTAPDYDWWSNHIGRPLAPGTFGENLLISELESASLNIGDRFRIGAEALLEVTSPRVPCVTIAARMEDPQFVRKFREAEKPGVYCRVIKAGTVQENDPVQWIPHPGVRVTVLEFFRLYYQKQPSKKEIQHLLRAPIHFKTRAFYEEMLAGR